jgi:hypothetical protein
VAGLLKGPAAEFFSATADIAGKIPCPPVAAFVVGFVLYLILAKIGLESKTLEMPADEPKGDAPA